MRKSEFLMLKKLKSAPHLNDTLVMIDDNDTTNAYNIMLNYEPITNYTPHHELSPRRRCPCSPVAIALAAFVILATFIVALAVVTGNRRSRQRIRD